MVVSPPTRDHAPPFASGCPGYPIVRCLPVTRVVTHHDILEPLGVREIC